MTALPTIADIAAWYDENGLATDAWQDRSGNAQHLTALGTVVVEALLNGKNVARLDGIAATFRRLTSPIGLNPSAYTMVLVSRVTNTATAYGLTLSNDYGNPDIGYASVGAWTDKWFAEAYRNVDDAGVDTPDPDPADDVTAWALMEFSVVNGIGTFWVDGELRALANVGDGIATPVSFDRLYVGSFADAEGFVEGDIALAALFTKALSEEERTTLHEWLNTEFAFALPVEAPSDPAVLAAIVATEARELSGAIQVLPDAFVGETDEELDAAIRIVSDRAASGAVTYTPPALSEYLEEYG